MMAVNPCRPQDNCHYVILVTERTKSHGVGRAMRRFRFPRRRHRGLPALAPVMAFHFSSHPLFVFSIRFDSKGFLAIFLLKRGCKPDHNFIAFALL
ncbi:TPA: hypothetical protein ACGD77_003884 [Serratia marcescens]